MMGMQGIRNNAWMNETAGLMPVKKMSIYTIEGSFPATPQVFEPMTVANFTQQDRLSDTSKLQEDCDFDKIIMNMGPTIGEEIKITDKGEFAVSVVKPESGNMDMSFLESINKDSAIFDCEILDSDMKRNHCQSMDDIDIDQDSAIESDNSLQFKMQALKQEKEAEAAKAKMERIEENENTRK